MAPLIFYANDEFRGVWVSAITASVLFKYSVSHNDICKGRKLQITNGKCRKFEHFRPWTILPFYQPESNLTFLHTNEAIII